MKKILIISSEYTGHGHKSVHTSLLQGFKALYREEIECKVVNGFTLGGPDLMAAERLYNSCIKYAPQLWYRLFKFRNYGIDFLNFLLKIEILSIKIMLLMLKENF